MKFDLDVTRRILEAIEMECIREFLDETIKENPYPEWTECQFIPRHLVSRPQAIVSFVIARHIQLLNDQGAIEGINPSFVALLQKYCFRLHEPRLTAFGHELLTAMRNDNLWRDITLKASSAGCELTLDGLKAVIPSVLKSVLM